MRRLVLLTAALALFATGSASASPGYRYWSYWLGDNGGWVMSERGAGSVVPGAGEVHGWRFITAGVDPAAELAPRSAPDFAAICGDAVATTGQRLVAIVIDYGDPSDHGGEAPPAVRTACVEIPAGDSALAATAAAAELRDQAGFVCGLDNWPATGCGESAEVANADPAEERLDTIARVVTAVLGVVMFAVAWQRMQWQKKQRRRPSEDDGEVG